MGQMYTICAITRDHECNMAWKYFPYYWPFMKINHQSQLDSPHKGPLTHGITRPQWVNTVPVKSPWRIWVKSRITMMISSNGNIVCVTGHLCREFTGHLVNSPHKVQWHGALMFSLICAWVNGWVNNRKAGDLRCQHTHYGVTIMLTITKQCK